MFAILLTACLTNEPVLVDRIVAVVNDDVITLSELNKRASLSAVGEMPDARRMELEKTALDSLITETLVNQQVREARIEVSEEDIVRAIDDILRQRSMSRADLEEAIRQRGMSMSEYRKDIERQLVHMKLIDLKVRSRVVVSDADLRAEWERSASLERRERLVKLRHLFFRWNEDASSAEKRRVLERSHKARARIVAGEPFAAVAKAVSEGPTALEGGDLGWLGEQSLLVDLARIVAKMKAGELSMPIETATGVHVVWIEDFKMKEPQSYEEAKSAIHQRLYQQEVERQMKLWVEEVRAQSAVRLRWP